MNKSESLMYEGGDVSPIPPTWAFTGEKNKLLLCLNPNFTPINTVSKRPVTALCHRRFTRNMKLNLSKSNTF